MSRSRERYSIGELARLAGVSVRTLRLYEEMGLVVPARTSNGYRSYSASDARRLAQVLSMRECGLPLAVIAELLKAGSEAEIGDALASHLVRLHERRAQLEKSIRCTEAAMARIERMKDMDAEQAFEDMKRESVKRFEAQYGPEARRRYGDAAIDGSNSRMLGMTRRQWDDKEALERDILAQLGVAMETGDVQGPAARELVAMHRRWIGMHWGAEPTHEQYVGLAHGYLADPRFTRYYDDGACAGATVFLASAMEALG